VAAASIGTFNDYKGDVGSLQTTVGDLGTLWVGCGNIGDVIVAGSAGKISASGDIVGNVIVSGDIGSLSFDDVYGTTAGLVIVAGGRIGQVNADILSGGQVDGGWLGLFAGNGVDSLTACKMTAGSNSTLDIAVQGGLGVLSVGTLDGGTATAGHFAQATLSVNGNVGKLIADKIIGGDGAGQAQLIISINQYTDSSGNVQAGDLKYLKAGLIAGGDADSADASLSLFVFHDLVTACIGKLTGSFTNTTSHTGCGTGGHSSCGGHTCGGFSYGGHTCGDWRTDFSWHCSSQKPQGGDPSVNIIVGHDIVKFSADEINGGTATGAGALAYVRIDAGHDIVQFSAGKIVGGTSTGGGMAYVDILAEHDILNMSVGTLLGSSLASTDNHGGCGGDSHGGQCGGDTHGGQCGGGCSKGDPAVQIHAYNNIKNFSASEMAAGEDGFINILAGLMPGGVVSGEVDSHGVFRRGSLGNININTIDADDGQITIAASGDIVMLQSCSVSSGDTGRVNVVAGQGLAMKIGSVSTWVKRDASRNIVDSGVKFTAGGAINDITGRVSNSLEHANTLNLILPVPLSL
jgi:hypothetical protein